ncbi:polysaccharide biosynthesis tyrosine autokinase [Boseongicola aestuarii]|uniref:Tyrosine-protein kinase etk n=1 Tax=Boseongicola aestuarii TaxID=1470561 RepID=A0A238J139_9RHOB|nr:polysaccharide biosynthesis tyrosine autokinase [Boseongicola aestuarii]SMX23624.1 Tyrosine-protein kinase etk [Boseongicola aestuarii]
MTTENSGSAQNIEDDEIDLGQLFALLWGRKFTIAGFTILAGAIGLAVALATPPTYRADALLQLEEKSGLMSLPTALSEFADSDPRSATEIEILRSRLVLGKAVADLHLDWQVEPLEIPLLSHAVSARGLPLPEIEALRQYSRGDATIRLDLLDVPPNWIDAEIMLTSGGDDSFSLTLPDGSTVDGRVGNLIGGPERGFGLRIGELEAPVGRKFLLRQREETGAINDLRERMSVSERGRQSGILEVSLTGSDRAETQRTLAAITESYLRQNVNRSAAEAESSLNFIETQLPEAERAVIEAEDALNDYRQEQQAIDLGFEGQSLLTQIGTIETELRRLAGEEDEIAERYTQNHPVYQQLLSARARLNEQLATLRDEVNTLPTTQREVFNLTRDLELAQEVYLQLLNRAQELQVLKASTIGNVRIVDSSRTAPKPIAPRLAVILALSLVLGLVLSIANVLLRQWLHSGIQDPDELERLGLPVFATVNRVPAMEGRRRRGSDPILALSDPGDLATEAIRSLRTSLHFGMLDAKTRSVALTSPAPNAGKSFMAVNLAVVAAEAGQRVCLVDADLRRGHLRRYLQVPKSAEGLSELLSGSANLDNVLQDGPVDGMSFISTGRFPPNPSELLMRPAFGKLVAELDKRFDLTIIDTPPVLAVTDPVVIGRTAGACIIITRYETTPLGEVEAVLRQLKGAGVKPSGAVLNAFDPARAKKAGAQVYAYRYDYRPNTD